MTVPRPRWQQRFDACVVATHADEALALLGDAERRRAPPARRVPLHSPIAPCCIVIRHSCRGAGGCGRAGTISAAAPARQRTLSLTYWMNNLQPLGERCPDLFVTLNPAREIARRRARSRHSTTRIRCSMRRRWRRSASCGGCRAAAHMVLRQLFRLWLPRGRAAGGPGRGRGHRRRAPAVARGGRIGAHPSAPAVRGPDVDLRRWRRRNEPLQSCAYVGTVVHKRLDAAPARVLLSRVLAVPRRRRDRSARPASCGCSRAPLEPDELPRRRSRAPAPASRSASHVRGCCARPASSIRRHVSSSCAIRACSAMCSIR